MLMSRRSLIVACLVCLACAITAYVVGVSLYIDDAKAKATLEIKYKALQAELKERQTKLEEAQKLFNLCVDGLIEAVPVEPEKPEDVPTQHIYFTPGVEI